MALSRDKKRVLPCLLDRLTSDDPGSQDSAGGAQTMAAYRLSVRRDLEWLLNCQVSQVATALAGTVFARESVLAYGVPCFSGKSVTPDSLAGLVRDIRNAILAYEPRIAAASLRVELEASEGEASDHDHGIAISITGELWAAPIPERLHLRTDLDLEAGFCRVSG